MKNIISRIIIRIRKFIIKYSSNPRPPSTPYISGDSFRNISDHIHDETKTLVPELVCKNDVVFVKTDLTLSFLKEIHPQIKHPYKLITHNSDLPVDSRYFKYIDEKIIHWFAQNNTEQHNKITPIPIGLENICLCDHGRLSFFKTKKISPEKKVSRILFGFNIYTNPEERIKAHNALSNTVLAHGLPKRLNTEKYMKTVSKYKFVASPAGNGLDCIRTWEAMYKGTVPIIKKTSSMQFFKDIGLPIFLIDDWNELKNITETELENIYNKLYNQFNSKALWTDYWIKLIKNEQNSIRTIK